MYKNNMYAHIHIRPAAKGGRAWLRAGHFALRPLTMIRALQLMRLMSLAVLNTKMCRFLNRLHWNLGSLLGPMSAVKSCGLENCNRSDAQLQLCMYFVKLLQDFPVEQGFMLGYNSLLCMHNVVH